jgi:Uncharacterized protein conserved in bacteria
MERTLTDTDLSLTGRRQFLGMAGMAGAAFILGPTLGKVAEFLGGKPALSDPLADLPEEWYEILGEPLKGYASFLGGLRLKHISVRQIIEPHLKMRGQVRSGIPPAKMWMKMKPTLLVADMVAERLGENVETVISAYRSPAYNARCPGAAPDSQHTRNVALDLVFRSSSKKVTAVAKDIRAEGRFKGGIGRYPGFTHIDTRGTNATWG